MRSVTPGGHWSSYAPHKHDCDAMPDESFLEETYHHRVDTALLCRGCHSVSAPPGYDLEVMAGPPYAWAISNDPDHEWMLR